MASPETTPDLLSDAAERRTAGPEPQVLLQLEPALAAMLTEAERRVDRVLEDMPPAFVDARRLIGRELWPLPRPEELQTIIKVAADREAEGPRRDLPRRFLALRLVVEDLTHAYWDPMLLDAGEIWCRAQDLRTMAEAVERVESILEPGPGFSAGVAFEDRIYLKTVAHALSPRRDLIAAAITLAHPLVEIMEVAEADDVQSRIPSLTREELDLLKRSASNVQPREGPGGAVEGAGVAAGDASTDDVEAGETVSLPEDPGADPARRHIGLEVMAVRWLIHGDIAEWEALFREAAEMQPEASPEKAPQGAPADAPLAPGTEASAVMQGPVGGASEPRPEDAEDAVRIVDEDGSDADGDTDATASHDDARAADTAPAAGAADGNGRPRVTLVLTPDQMERRLQIQKRALEHQVLYGVVSERLQKIQDEALLMRQKATTEWLAAFRRPLVASYSRLLTIVHNQAPGAPAPDALYVPEDEPVDSFAAIFEEAVTQADEKRTAEEASKAAEPERLSRKARLQRYAVMTLTILALSGVAGVVWYMVPKPPPDALVFSPSEARNVISLSETRPIGTMLYAKLSGEWDPFSDQEKEREVVSLARLAVERGFHSLYLVDDSGEPLAQWDPMHGPKLFPHAPSK